MPEPLHFTDAEKVTYRAAFAPTANDEQWALFITECERRALVPGTHVVFNLRAAKEWNPTLKQEVSVQKVALITTINALRLIAERTAKYDGHGPFTYYYGVEGGDDLKESKIPLGRVPHAVSVEGFRKDWRVPLFATARYDAYVQTKKDGNKSVPTKMWASRGEEQLAKCCEALMLRTVAPEECAGLLITEELGNDVIDREENVSPTVVEKVTVPEATLAPAVNQAPAKAEGTVLTPGNGPYVPNNGPEPKVDPKPQPTPAPAPAVTVAPAQAPAGLGLFTETNRPDPAHETTAFPPAAFASVGTPVSTTSPVSAPAEKPAATGDAPATPIEYATFINQRATKIIRDKLPKAGMKPAECSEGVKNYLLKGSSKTALKHISAVDFERLLKALEDVTPEQAAEIVKAAK